MSTGANPPLRTELFDQRMCGCARIRNTTAVPRIRRHSLSLGGFCPCSCSATLGPKNDKNSSGYDLSVAVGFWATAAASPPSKALQIARSLGEPAHGPQGPRLRVAIAEAPFTPKADEPAVLVLACRLKIRPCSSPLRGIFWFPSAPAASITTGNRLSSAKVALRVQPVIPAAVLRWFYPRLRLRRLSRSSSLQGSQPILSLPGASPRMYRHNERGYRNHGRHASASDSRSRAISGPSSPKLVSSKCLDRRPLSRGSTLTSLRESSRRTRKLAGKVRAGVSTAEPAGSSSGPVSANSPVQAAVPELASDCEDMVAPTYGGHSGSPVGVRLAWRRNLSNGPGLPRHSVAARAIVDALVGIRMPQCSTKSPHVLYVVPIRELRT